jgi:hypothetical protein
MMDSQMVLVLMSSYTGWMQVLFVIMWCLQNFVFQQMGALQIKFQILGSHLYALNYNVSSFGVV